MEYLYQKGITDIEISKFGLVKYIDNTFYGIKASKECQATIRYFKGVIGLDNGLQKYYNNVIIIPIYDLYGNIVSAGLRRCSNIKPKFMGIAGYNKSHNLYNLNRAYPAILEKGEVILVEGYWEVICLAKYGINNVVALCGCSLSSFQMSLLKRFTKKVLICLDPDDAGRKGTQKLETQLQRNEFEIYKIEYDEAIDLDEYIKKYNIERFLKSCGLFQRYTPQYQK